MRFRILTNLSEKGKKLLDLPDLPKDVFFFLVILAVGSGAFALGELVHNEQAAKRELGLIYNGDVAVTGATNTPALQQLFSPGQSKGEESMANTDSGKYVGTKNGTTYHLPWCSGAKRIKDENRVWFRSKEEAEARGYHPAANCKGI